MAVTYSINVEGSLSDDISNYQGDLYLTIAHHLLSDQIRKFN